MTNNTSGINTEININGLKLETFIPYWFNLVNVAVVCAILESISGFEPSSLITEPRYLKFVTL